jgi:hypothetical protein
MSRLLKSQNYLMKCLGFVLLCGFISLGAIGGCSNNNGGQDGTRVLTENDFANDTTLSANPEKHLIVKFLEHPDSEGHENDTGGVGHDIIPHTYTRTLEHTFCWEDEDDDSGHFMELDDSDGNEILRVDTNGVCVTKVIEAGDYVMTIWHDGRILTTHPVFIIPNPEDTQQARATDGLINGFKVVIANILKNIQNTVSKDARAQTVQDNINTLISTNSCPSCNLTGANLSNANLSNANLSNANLSGAKLDNAVLSSADLTGVTLSSTDFSGATWCDGQCMCDDNSFDTCIGCASIDICVPLTLSQQIKGMAYDPRPSNFEQNPDNMYFDDDFYNQDFCQLWGNKTSVGCSQKPDKFRDDLMTMKNIGVNFIRMYDWNWQRDHQGFLEYAADMGIKVTIPFCNGCMATETAEKIIDDINNYSDKAKSAIALFIVGNELNGFLDFIPQTLNAIKGASGTLSNVPICTPIKTNGSGKEAVVANALTDTTNVFNVYKSNNMEDRFIACVNFYGIGLPGSSENPSQQLEEFVNGMLARGTLLTNNSIPLLLSELGVFLVGGPALTNGMCSPANIEPNAGGDESLQAMWLDEVLTKSNDLIGTNPMYRGSVVFQFMNKNFSSVCPIDHNLGIFSLEQPSMPWQGEARNNNGNPPTDPPYPIDKLNETPRFMPVMNNY